MKSGTGDTNVNAQFGNPGNSSRRGRTPRQRTRFLHGRFQHQQQLRTWLQTMVDTSGMKARLDPLNTSGATGICCRAILCWMQRPDHPPICVRDDYIMMTSNVYNATPGGFTYVSGTYHVFGNNGNTAGFGAVDDAGNTALANVVQDVGTFITQSQLLTDLRGQPITCPWSPIFYSGAGTFNAGAGRSGGMLLAMRHAICFPIASR